MADKGWIDAAVDTRFNHYVATLKNTRTDGEEKAKNYNL